MKNLLRYLSTLTALFLLGNSALAQHAAQAAGPVITPNQLVLLLILTALVVAAACLVMATTLLYLVRQKQAQTVSEAAAETVAATAQRSESWISWKRINQVLTRAVPVAREADIDLGHDFDGIRELDNRLPPWWLWGFYFTIAFSVVYMFYYHVATDWSQDKQWAAEVEMENAKVAAYMKTKAEQVDENTVVLADASGTAAGKEIYLANCAACHGNLGEGGIGPNLTDNYWIHGGSLGEVFKIIKVGVPEKGMISWKETLRPVEIQNVSSFIMTLQGTNPPNGKAPQGELFEPEAPDEGQTEDGSVASK